MYSDLIESQVVGDAQANLFRMLVPRGQPGNMMTGEIKVPSYHRLRTTVFSPVAINIRSIDTICFWNRTRDPAFSATCYSMTTCYYEVIKDHLPVAHAYADDTQALLVLQA